MRRGVYIVLLTLVAALTHAQMHVECVSKATQRINGTDTLFIFKDNVELRSKIGNADWYSTETGMAVRTDMEYVYDLDDGGYYLVKGGVEYNPFYVFTCKTSELAMTVDLDCDATMLRLTGDVTPYSYTRRNGSRATYARTCSIDYNALVWNNDQWEDSAAQITMNLASTIPMDALYGKTPIKLCYDAELRDTLGLDPVCLTYDVTEEAVKAVKMELVTLGTARENDPAGNNELERPIEQILDAAMSYSGALEVAFYSNPTPAVQFYGWDIYQSTERIATRNDKDIRYTFSEPGSYRVVCKVSNRTCLSDSAEMIINISESYLRVPNVFTPNGDGTNDEFRVAYRSLREFHCWVYNRWGKLVYEWTDPAKGWDGTIYGKPAAEGAYYYVIRALGTDADKNARYTMKAVYNKKKLKADEAMIGVYQLSGDINLLRGKQ